MLATLTDAAHFGDESGWAFEMKWDSALPPTSPVGA